MSWADMVSSTQSGSFVQCLALAEGAGLSGQHLRAKSQTPSNFHLSGSWRLGLSRASGSSFKLQRHTCSNFQLG